MSDFAIRFLNSEGEPITQETVDKLVCKIRENHCRSAWYMPVNSEYGTSKEDAPVNISGQTPVLKRNALNDLNLVAECVLHFAKTGELYPKLKWEEVA